MSIAANNVFAMLLLGRFRWAKRGAIIAFFLVLATIVWPADAGFIAIRHALDNAASLLAMRSPGERDAGALLQTKLAKSRVLPTGRRHGSPGRPIIPEQRVLSVGRVRPGPVGFSPAGGTPLLVLDTDNPLPPLGSLSSVPSAFQPIPIGPPGAGGVGGGVAPPDAPVSAVPETSTWICLMIGFFLIGSALRRSRRNVQRRPRAEPDNRTPAV